MCLAAIALIGSPAPASTYPVILNKSQVADLCMLVSDKLSAGAAKRRYAFDESIRQHLPAL